MICQFGNGQKENFPPEVAAWPHSLREIQISNPSILAPVSVPRPVGSEAHSLGRSLPVAVLTKSAVLMQSAVLPRARIRTLT
jgi:hypothetical protein